ncbi:MAG TPA: DUF4440 domain-containing protein [Gemmatimonadaceae bacterium]|nr:DUF4440 domain-containing protein [Gemmatimonadaceae bacterium]
MRPILRWAVVASVLGCTATGESGLSPGQTAAIKEEVEKSLREAYDLSKPNVAERMLSLYPQSGPVVSAAAGTVVTSRDSLAQGIEYFWNNVGRNMRSPQWIWDRFWVDVTSPTSAVVTATYHIPHRDPRNRPHEIAGAMTALFEKRGGKWVIIQEHLSDRPAAPEDTTSAEPAHQHQ